MKHTRNPHPPAVCTADGCNHRHMAKGWCSMHYTRAKHGWDMSRPPLGHGLTAAFTRGDFAAARDALLVRTDPDGDCLIWRGAKTAGYGSVYFAGRTRGAHRAMGSIMEGRVLEGHEVVHHLCGNRACISPAHLVVTTQSENTAEMLERHSYLRRIAELEQALRQLDPMHPLLPFTQQIGNQQG